MRRNDRIHRKYEVRRTDGSKAHDECAYFVLDLACDEFAIPAIRAYAKACKKQKPELAADLVAMADAPSTRCGCREASCPHSLGQALLPDGPAGRAHELMAAQPVRLSAAQAERQSSELAEVESVFAGGLGDAEQWFERVAEWANKSPAAMELVRRISDGKGHRLIWFRRSDDLWNADCACGASCCGIAFNARAECEQWHFERADIDRANGNKYKPCGPKFPDPNPNDPSPWVFA